VGSGVTGRTRSKRDIRMGGRDWPESRSLTSRLLPNLPASFLPRFSLKHFNFVRGDTMWVGSTTHEFRLTDFHSAR
jgi:hypothetical protein